MAKRRRRKVMVRWVKAVTPLGSEVQVGVVEGSGDVYLFFRSSPRQGKRLTRVALSRVAMDTLDRLWHSWLDFEAKQGQWTYLVKTLFRRLPSTVPWAYAGIPPVEEPYAVREETR